MTAPTGELIPMADESETYELCVNGRVESVKAAWLGESLLYVLRERLGLPGSKNACEQGECGSCTVYLDGVLVCSCTTMAADAAGSAVTTVEGLAPGHRGDEAGRAGRELTDVQRGFLEAGAVQCGFCTPGLVVAVHDLLDRSPDASELQVREAISGNLCRCTGYGRILAAVEAVKRLRSEAAT